MTAKEYQAKYGQCATTQDAPASGKSSTKPTGTSPANALTKAAIQLLQLRGWHAWRQNNAAVYDASFGGYRKGSTTLGISDILCFHKLTGRLGAVEVKWGKDTLSDEQAAFLADVIAAGGFGCECRSLDQLDRELSIYLDSLTP
jgi:hypothetical protein